MSENNNQMLYDSDKQIYAVKVKGKTYGIAGADGAAEKARVESEAARKTSETARSSAEGTRDQNEQERRSNEAMRTSSEGMRKANEDTRVMEEQDRVSSESARKAAETNRASAESSRQIAETARVDSEDSRQAAESSRASAESARVAADQQRDFDQAKNNSDQALNNAAAQGLQVVKLTEGQYDPTSGEPTVEGQVGKLYFVPTSNGVGDDLYTEWMLIDSEWEKVGSTTASIDPIVTDQIDAVSLDQSPVGGQVLNLTGLSYLWNRIKSAFAYKSHTHPASDVTSGTLPLARGGTGSGDATAARAALGAASSQEVQALRDSVSQVSYNGRISFSWTSPGSDQTAGLWATVDESEFLLMAL
jgi:hypothetical protein